MTLDHTDRFNGFATLPMQDPKTAIAEQDRAVNQLGLVVAMISMNLGLSSQFRSHREVNKIGPVVAPAQHRYPFPWSGHPPASGSHRQFVSP